ncbi:hypothetical protein ABZ876_08110 [Streptomyces sp. NPDC046931]|uniref:hypothetical protein n=1 Tax=Streptomyces sp. NPDC046931 TaxID=3154806 RepID=UPI0034040080
MTAFAAYKTARILAAHGLDSDTATTSDIDAAADHAGSPRPANAHDRHAVRIALDAIGDAR